MKQSFAIANLAHNHTHLLFGTCCALLVCSLCAQQACAVCWSSPARYTTPWQQTSPLAQALWWTTL